MVANGLIDPEQGGVEAMLAARAAATSNTSWGEIHVPAATDEGLLDAAAHEAAAQEAERHRFLALAHVLACTLTTTFVRTATSGWATVQHWLHHATVRTAVHTLVLVSERLRQVTKDDDEVLPPELWLVVARFFRRSDWPMGRLASGGAGKERDRKRDRRGLDSSTNSRQIIQSK